MKRIIFILLLIAGTAFSSSATHIAGCDLSYTCIGGNDYIITLSFYRDCSGTYENETALINFTSSCGNFSVTLNKIAPINGIEVTPVCPGQVTTCGGGSLYGLEKFVYQGQVTLAPCANWTMSYNLCCRNPSNTISNPGSANMYIPATLNNLVAPCNSSPTFSNPPSTIICNGQQFCFNHGAIDPDGDSLVYTLVTPYDLGPGGSPVYVTYLGGYSAQQPLPSSPPVYMDPLTGDICMTPTTNITTVMAVLVQEWRYIGGVPTMIGSVLRDMQLTVVSCSNQIPTLGGINPNATQYDPNDTIFALPVCLGDTVAFSIYANDPDTPPDNLTLSWNNGITDATWNVTGNGTPNPVGNFFWVPSSAYISNVPYCFTVNIKDDNCPYVGQQTFSYCLTIAGIDINFGLPADTLLCMGESFTINAVGDSNCVNYAWTLDGSPTTPINDSTYFVNSSTLGIGDHTVLLNVDNGILTQCPGIDFVNVKVVPLPDVNLGPDDTICDGQSINLDAGIGAQYIWIPTLETTQTISVNATGTYMVEVDGGINTRCTDNDTIYIKVLQMPLVDIGPDICSTDPVVLDAGNPGFEYQWTDGDGNPIGNTQTITASSSGNYNVAVAELLGYGCDVNDVISVRVIPEPIITLGPDSTICQHQSIELEVHGVGIDLSQYDYTYYWYPTFETTPYTVQAWLPEGTIPFIISVTGCTTVSDTLNLTVNICDLTIPNIITPNGDNLNDNFKVPNLEYYPNSQLIIYNRWGRKVYESSNYQNDWNGEKCSDGVYYFILQVNFGNTGNGEKVEEHNGTLTILR
jgi:gliding motility-associated-like protein